MKIMERNTPPHSRRIIVGIVGAGIGGLTAVLTLRHFGVDAVCFERASALREIGSGIQIGPNASRVLLQLGLGDALEAVAAQPIAIEIRRWRDGRMLRKIVAPPTMEELFGAPYFTFHRADLHDALAAVVPKGGIQLGKECTGASQVDNGVELRFADGSSFHADAVIGADGLRSTLRRAFESGPPRFAGKIGCRVLVDAGEIPELVSPPMTRMWLGPGQHIVSYPVRCGRLLNFAAALPATRADLESWTRETDVSELVDALRGWDDPDIRRVLGAARTMLRLPLFDRPPLSSQGQGRLTLLGDAAHPMLPFFAQGASQAIEDAWVVARCLHGVETKKVPAALRRYEAARRARTAHVQARSIRNGELFTLPDGLRQGARDLVLRRLSLKSFSWLYGYDVLNAPV